MHGQSRRRRRATRLPIFALAAMCALAAGLALAFVAVGDQELPGSSFEIDGDANLVVDDGGLQDWVSVDENRQADEPTGQTDNAYKGGVKEDTECPAETTGTIPNNKSDLLAFGVYEEPGDPGFLNLFWSRVNEPSGTTLMDFEFNKSDVDCPTGPNKVRSQGDLLVEYAIDHGGANASITTRRWSAADDEWTDPVNVANAVGTINESEIPFGESDGLIDSGVLSERTFGEAQIDLSELLPEGSCEAFGSATLKSRSSDSFTSQLKDFISPVPVDIRNCGKVIIRKQTIPDGAAGEFDFAHDLQTDPASGTGFTLEDDGVRTFDNVLFGEDYAVTETGLADDFVLDDVDCSASNVPVDEDEATLTATFDVTSASDVVDCTFYNRLEQGAIKVQKTSAKDASGLADATFEVRRASDDSLVTELTTNASGSACVDELSFGDYTVTETGAPDGYGIDQPNPVPVTVDSVATCTTGDPEGPLPFTDTPLSEIEVSFTSLAGPGVTAASIVCKHPDGTVIAAVSENGSPDPAFDDTSETFTNLAPSVGVAGTYTCEVEIDP